MKRRLALSAIAAGVAATGAAGKGNMNTDHIEATLEDKPCEVYFFGSWSTYRHPVTPTGAIHLEQALTRARYYRAWLCDEGRQRRFVYFEAVSQKREAVDLALPGGVAVAYLPRPGPGPAAIERPLKAAELLSVDEFIIGDAERKAQRVRQKVVYRYLYRYRPDGGLLSATVTNVDGKVTVLNF